MSVALARRIVSSGCAPAPEEVAAAHGNLLGDAKYVEAVSRTTANEQSVRTRMAKAAERFGAP